MGYVRKRRLTEAAQRLAGGDPVRLIELALDSGFESQAAFTRAFKRQFGLPPGEVRRSGRSWLPRCCWPLDAAALNQLSESITMEPRFTERDDITFVGLREAVDQVKGGDGPSVWRRFRPFVDKIKHRPDGNSSASLRSSTRTAAPMPTPPGSRVERTEDVPEDLTTKTLKGGRFAVFTHTLASPDIGTELRRTFRYIYGTWLPKSGVELRAWYDLEYYDERFDPEAMSGEIDIWVPVK